MYKNVYVLYNTYYTYKFLETLILSYLTSIRITHYISINKILPLGTQLLYFYTIIYTVKLMFCMYVHLYICIPYVWSS